MLASDLDAILSPQAIPVPADVSGDSLVTPQDALTIIDYLNQPKEISDQQFAQLDVNSDGTITPLDALQVITFLNEQTRQQVEGAPPEIDISISADAFVIYNPDTGEIRIDPGNETADITQLSIQSRSGIFTGDAAQNVATDAQDRDTDFEIFKVDENGFGSVSFGNVAQLGLTDEFILDDIVVVGRQGSTNLSSEDVIVSIHFEHDGEVVEQVVLGDFFDLVVTVEDTRFGTDDARQGVSTAYMDIAANYSEIIPNGEIQFGSDFPEGQSSAVGFNRIDDIGAFGDTARADGSPTELVRVRMKALLVGASEVTTRKADDSSLGEMLLYGRQAAVEPNRVVYGSNSIEVVSAIEEGAPDLVQFAKDLAASGTKLYGASWNTLSRVQMELFEDGLSFLPFIEVTDYANQEDFNQLNAVGTENEIISFPTWIFPDGSRFAGFLTLESIAQQSDVAIPTSDSPTLIGLEDVDLFVGSPLHIPLDGWDPNGGPLAYSVSSDSDLVEPVLIEGNRTMEISVDAAGASFGKMQVHLFEQRAPDVTAAITSLVDQGIYEDVIFHRIINGFMIQGGDPTGTGFGDPNVPSFDDQFHVELQHNRKGVVSMAKSQDDTNSSQFFVTETNTRNLDFHHSVFGQLVEGEFTRDAISNTFTDSFDRPVNNVVIDSVSLFNDLENGMLMLRTNGDQEGTANITVTVTDADDNSFEQIFTVTVKEDTRNSLPFMEKLPTLTTTVDQPLTFQLPGVDVEGDPILYRGEKTGDTDYDLTVDPDTGEVTIVPPAGFSGSLFADFSVRQPEFPNRGGDNSVDYQRGVEITVTAAGPATPTIDLESTSDFGLSDSDNITNAIALRLHVSNVSPNASVQLTVRDPFGAEETVQQVAGGDENSVTFELDDLDNSGDYTFFARQEVDSVQSDLSDALNVTILRRDLTAIEGVVPTEISLGDAIEIDFQHNLEGNETIEYSISGLDLPFELETSEGQFSATPTEIGNVSFSVDLSDVAGNSTSRNISVLVVDSVDQRPPQLVLDLAAESDTGTSDSDNLTNANSIRIDISNARANALVKLTVTNPDDVEETLQQTVDADGGSVFFELSNMIASNGDYTLTATQEVDSLESNISDTLAITILRRDLAAIEGIVPDLITENETLSIDFQHELEGTESVTYSLTGIDANFELNAENGQFSFTPSEVGRVSFSLAASDQAGNVVSQDYASEVVQRPATIQLDLAAESDTGFSDSDQVTNAQVVRINVSGIEAGSLLKLTVRDPDDVETTQELLVSGDIPEFIELSELVAANGTYTLTALQEMDSLQSDVSEPLAFTILRRDLTEIQGVLPQKITIGESVSVDFQHDLEGNETIEYVIDGLQVPFSFDNQTGQFDLTPEQIGSLSFSVGVSDLAGNATSRDLTLEVRDLVENPDLVRLANDLTAAGAILYGTPWDVSTASQRTLFDDAAAMLPFVDVTNAHRDTNQIGIDQQIERFPTWVFADGSRLEGVQAPSTLAAAASVSLEEAVAPWLEEIADTELLQGSPLHIPLNGFDATGDGINYTVAVDSEIVEASILTGNRSLELMVEGYGAMVFELFEQRAPETTQAIIDLVEQGFYDGKPFYLANDHQLQAGEGLSVNHMPADPVHDSFHADLQHNRSGVLSLAKLADDANSTDFFVTSSAHRSYDFDYSIVGQLVEGESVRNAIQQVAKSVGGAPKFSINIESARVFDNTEDAVLMLKTNASVGEANVEVTATDASGRLITEAFDVTLAPDSSNSGPFLAPIAPIEVSAGQSIRIPLEATDLEGDTVRFHAENLSDTHVDFSIDAATSELLVAPPAGFTGQIEIRVLAYQFGVVNRVDRFDRETITLNVSLSTGDFSGDGIVDAMDIDILCQAVRDNSSDNLFDVNSDGSINADDANSLVVNVLGTVPGDANLDGVFNTTDLIELFTASEFEDSVAQNSTWATGDWNCDAEFDTSDLLAAFVAGGFVIDEDA